MLTEHGMHIRIHICIHTQAEHTHALRGLSASQAREIESSQTQNIHTHIHTCIHTQAGHIHVLRGLSASQAREVESLQTKAEVLQKAWREERKKNKVHIYTHMCMYVCMYGCMYVCDMQL